MTAGEQVDLSISVITSNNRDILRDCLHSILRHTHRISVEIIAVDNASTDNSAEMVLAEFPSVKLIRNAVKQGFSTNHNKALQQAGGRYLMILNDDVVVLDGAFDQLVTFMDEHPGVGVVGPKFLNPDGSNQPAFEAAITPFLDLIVNPWRRLFKPSFWDRHEMTKAASVVGACLLVRREAVQQVGFLDTAFDPLYSEEHDWCHRIRTQGWEIFHLPQARIVHLGGQTRKRTPEFWTKTIYQHKLLYYQKHGSWAQVLCYRLLLSLLSGAKVAYWGGRWLLVRREREPSRRRLACHWAVATQIGLAGRQA